MIKQKQDIVSLVGRAVFIVFLTFLIAAISSNHENSETKYAKQGLVCHTVSIKTNVDAIVSPQLPLFQKYLISVIDKLSLRFSDNNFKLRADNQKSIQTIISLQKYEQLIKPLNIRRFYHYLFPSSAEELPVLS
jgi:hypothetical protein